jgi:hypothetical protein
MPIRAREGVERIRRDVQAHQVERLARLDERCAEEGCGLQVRKHHREQQHRGEGNRPQQQQHDTDLQAERLRLLQIQIAQPGDDRDRDVRQHRHLQELDEGVGEDLKDGCALADEQADENAGDEADEDSSREARRSESGRHAHGRMRPHVTTRGSLRRSVDTLTVVSGA